MPELASKLVAIFEAYWDRDEFRQFAALFDVALDALAEWEFTWLSVASELVLGLEYGNNRRLLDSLLDLASSRNSTGIAISSFEALERHNELCSIIADARAILAGSPAPSELTVGGGTLDCLRDSDLPIRLLTGAHSASVETGFDGALTDFSGEGHSIQYRDTPVRGAS